MDVLVMEPKWMLTATTHLRFRVVLLNPHGVAELVLHLRVVQAATPGSLPQAQPAQPVGQMGTRGINRSVLHCPSVGSMPIPWRAQG